MSNEGQRGGQEPGGRSDEALAGAARCGSLEAFSELVRRHQERLFSFLLQKTGNRQDAEDLAQTAFLTAYRNLSRYRSRDRFTAWLLTIAHRQAISHFRSVFRRKRLYEEIEEDDDRHDPASIAESREEARSLWRTARAILSEEQHTALWLFYAEQMPVSEIGRVLGKRRGSVKVMLHRARNALAERLGGEKYESTARKAERARSQRAKGSGGNRAPEEPRRHECQPEVS